MPTIDEIKIAGCANTLTLILDTFGSMTAGKHIATDRQVDEMKEHAVDLFQQLPTEERLRFAELAMLNLLTIFAKLGRDMRPDAQEALARRESPTQPDAAQPCG
jgi:hypothetical protein